MDKKEFFRKELKVDKANGLQKLWYNLNEKPLMDAVSEYMQAELKSSELHIVSNCKNIKLNDEVSVEIYKEGTVTEIDGSRYYVQFWEDGCGDWFDDHEIERTQ